MIGHHQNYTLQINWSSDHVFYIFALSALPATYLLVNNCYSDHSKRHSWSAYLHVLIYNKLLNHTFVVLGAPCVHEMFQLLGCWKSNAYDDAYCREEIQSFMNCVSQQVTSLFHWQ